ncbi:MAG: LuxR C-terminal-related transcriptional regulator [Burkholderiaceae bacterium]
MRHPECVSHLVLQSTYARGRLVRSHSAEQREEALTMRRLAALGWGKDDASFRQFFTSRSLPGGTAEQHRWFNEMERVSTNPANAAQFMSVFDDIDIVEMLPPVKCPTLVLHCQRDLRVPFGEDLLVASAIPGAEFVPIDRGNTCYSKTSPAGRAGRRRWSASCRAPVTCRPAAFEQLSLRQREVLELLVQGRDNSQIAATLGLSEKTVRNQVSAIFAKLEVESREQAIVRAREAGLGRG